MKISIIVPVRNGGPAFSHCLEALSRARAECADLASTELIVVDDGSTDDSLALARGHVPALPPGSPEGGPLAAPRQERARGHAARALATPAPGGHGPAAARNLGARAASGEIAFFVDADVALHPDALRRAAEAFQADPTLEACFGSYDDAPAAPNFLSQYKNLFHHYIHQHAHAQASTFWTGCGAIRLATFNALGGFDPLTYRRPSIEDIDLGYRLRRRGGEIRLLKEMQCSHLKRWTAQSLLRADIFERGIPWTILLWRESRARRTAEPLLATGDWVRLADPALARKPFLLDLNLQTSNRLSVALTAMLALSLFTLPLTPNLWPVPSGLAGTLLLLNWRLYTFFYRKRGARFTLAAIVWHWLYYLYNNLSFGLGTLHYFLRGARPVAADGSLTVENRAPARDA
jgi:glycosyltransferase involved in cell wall biosynthesis